MNIDLFMQSSCDNTLIQLADTLEPYTGKGQFNEPRQCIMLHVPKK